MKCSTRVWQQGRALLFCCSWECPNRSALSNFPFLLFITRNVCCGTCPGQYEQIDDGRKYQELEWHQQEGNGNRNWSHLSTNSTCRTQEIEPERRLRWPYWLFPSSQSRYWIRLPWFRVCLPLLSAFVHPKMLSLCVMCHTGSGTDERGSLSFSAVTYRDGVWRTMLRLSEMHRRESQPHPNRVQDQFSYLPRQGIIFPFMKSGRPNQQLAVLRLVLVSSWNSSDNYNYFANPAEPPEVQFQWRFIAEFLWLFGDFLEHFPG